eukprot:m51a1_g1671 hypothetical protein (211) ;mRNA; r:391555-392603
MMTRATAAVLALCLACVLAGPPIQPRYDGLATGPSNPLILLEEFIDPACSDCQQANPIVRQVAAYYHSSLRYVAHIYPLPYHRNSFVAAKAIATVKKLSGDEVALDYVAHLYEALDQWSNPNDTVSALETRFATWAAQTAKIPESDFWSVISDTATEMQARASWKFVASRGVYGTPMFWVNGVLCDQCDGEWTFAQWRSFIDGLLKSQEL